MPTDRARPTGGGLPCVLHVLPGLEFGGLERFAVGLVRVLPSRGFSVVVCAPPGGGFERDLVTAGCQIVHIPAPSPNPWGQIRAGLALARVMTRTRPAVIHAHNPAATLAAWLGRAIALMSLRVPIVASYQGLPASRLKRAAAVFKRCADRVVSCGDAASAQLGRAGVPQSRLSSVPNAVSVESVNRSGGAPAGLGDVSYGLIVNVGRCVPQKNQSFLVDVADRLEKRGIDAKTVIVGEGPLRASLERQIERSALQNVHLLGARRDVLDIVACADVFVMTSLWEGLPLAAMEAMAVGTAVIAPRIDGFEELIRHEETGLLYAPGDLDDLADSLQRIITDAALRTRLGAAGQQEIASTRSFDHAVDSYAAVYRSVLRTTPTGRGAAECA